MESRRPWVNLFSSLPDQVKKHHRKIRNLTFAEMTGDSCLARAVVPCTAAAVDHADTELIGQLWTKYTGFSCGVFNWAVHQEI